ncbi:influenza virus NS1A-binding protein-like [Watersipora subatra]|uniref:influenza virus NS1A-binding protein-like n=1 Tax=Watersipora subatra TaxID=2589382 RepID=UPI00355AFA19
MKIQDHRVPNMDDEQFAKRPDQPQAECETYTDNQLASNILSSMHTLRQAGQLCDCILRVGKKQAEFTAHQAVLASVSPFFMAMFEQDPRIESLTKKTYNVKDISPESFQVLLDYAYTGSLKLNELTVKDVFEAAVKLKFQGVVTACSAYLIEHLDIYNCIDVRKSIESDVNLVETVNKFIQENLTSITETKVFFSLPHINMKLMGYSRGVIGGPDSNAVAKLISDWLLTLNSQEGDSTWSEAVVTTQSANNVARDMQVLTEHENVMFLDAENHLQTVSEMDESMSKTNAVQDYVKTYKKHYQSLSDGAVLKERSSGENLVDIIAHIEASDSTHNLLISINGVIYSMTVRMMFLPTSDRYGSTESVLNRNGHYVNSSSGSSAEEDEQAGGLEECYQKSSVSSFEPLAEMNQPRCGVGLASWEGKLIAFGGNDRAECLNTVEAYDPESNSWSHLPNMRCRRGRFDGVVVANKLYACGGSDGRRELNSIECFDGNDWKQRSNMLSFKSSCGIGALDDKLYMLGGYNGQRAEKSCEVYNPVNDSWSRIASLQEGRSQCAVCSYKGMLYVFGGTDSWNCSSTVEVYDPVKDQWSFTKSMPQARRGATATVFKGKIYILGGSDGSRSLNSVDMYDCETKTWCSGPSLQSPRSNAGATVISGRLYVTGGYGKNRFLSDMEVLEEDDDSKWCSYHKSCVSHTSSESDPDH